MAVERPKIFLTGAEQITYTREMRQDYTDQGAKCFSRDGSRELQVVTTGAVNFAKPGTYTLTYSCADKATNSVAAEKTRLVTIVASGKGAALTNMAA